jgi:hypothetical protein
MNGKALSLKVWIGVIISFFLLQIFIRLYFEEKIFYPRGLESLSDGHFNRLTRDFHNTSSDVLKVAVLGSSRVAKGIECPDDIQNILLEKGQPPVQLNKIWESFDPFEVFVEYKNFLKRLIPHKPDLICIQAEMLAIQMPMSEDKENLKIERKYKNIWKLNYKGDKKKYIPKKIKYQSKINQELAHTIVVGNPYFQGNGPCTINDVYANLDTLNRVAWERNIKREEDIRYTFDDLEMLKNAGIKVVIIETPFPFQFEKDLRTPTFNSNLEKIQKKYKNKFDIDYWEYTGPPLYYKYYADGGHLNPEGRLIYTKWLLDKIHQEIPAN